MPNIKCQIPNAKYQMPNTKCQMLKGLITSIVALLITTQLQPKSFGKLSANFYPSLIFQV